MQSYLQTVSTLPAKIKINIKKYILGLSLAKGLKNCLSMARELSTPRTFYYNHLRLDPLDRAMLKGILAKIGRAAALRGTSSAIVVDSTFIAKPFGMNLEGIGYHYDGVTKRVNKGLCLVVMAQVSQGVATMVDFKYYIAKKDATENYKTKIEIAKDLLKEYWHKLNADYICMDGGFMSKSMIEFLESIKSKYILRIPRNRLVTIDKTKAKLSEHPSLSLIKNQKSSTRMGFYKDHGCFFTIQKQKTKNGHRKVFIISNMDRNAKDQIKLYSDRWPVEKGFRTMKQKLGFSDCRMTANYQQTKHFLTVFLTYSLMGLVKVAKRKKSVDEVINLIRLKKQPSISNYFHELMDYFT